MPEFWAHLHKSLRGNLTMVSWIVATVLASLTGPLGTYESCTLLHRLLVWGCAVGLFIMVAAVARVFVGTVLKLTDFSRSALATAVIVALGVGFPVHATNLMTDYAMVHVRIGLTEVMTLAFAAALGVAAIQYCLSGGLLPGLGSGSAQDATAGMPRLVQRLDPALRGDLIAITGRDHYIDVQTTAGSGTLLMRFSDAIAEAAPVPGAQVHRSHWVAWSHVTGVERADGKIALVLDHQGRVPVSRNHRAKLEARGLL
ncbi:MAG: hypothetical protein RIT14_1053 [Pseudomonadota bacterium]